MHQLVGQLVVVLQGVHQRRRIDAEFDRRPQRQPQELGVTGGQGVLIGGPVDEVVGQVGTGLTRLADVVDGEVQLLEGEPADLANHAGDQVVGRLRQRMALRPRRAAVGGALLHPEEAVRVESQRAGAEVGEGVQGVAHDHAHPGERRVQPVDRRLTVLEVVQVDPAALDAVDTEDRAGDAPVGLLDALGEEDDPLQFADDVAGLVQPLLGRRVDVDRVHARRGLGQLVPVPWSRSRPCGRCRGSRRSSSRRAGSRRPCRCDRARRRR